MKIKTQLTVLITGVVLIPLICAIILPAYHYFSSSQRALLRNYNSLRFSDTFNESTHASLSDDDWNLLKEKLIEIQPGTDTLVYVNKTIVLSNFREFKSGIQIEPADLFDYIRRSTNKYQYEIRSSKGKKIITEQDSQSEKFSPDEDQIHSYGSAEHLGPKFLVISRYDINDGEKNPASNGGKFYLPLFLVFIAFEVFAVTLIIQLSTTLTNSLQVLEKNTEKIANGQLDIELEKPEIKRQNNEITNLTENLEKMRLSLKDAGDRRTRFLMGISHDLRTPIALIKGYAEAIADGVMDDTETIKKSLSVIVNKAGTLESMINELIDYVKLDNHEWRKKLVPEEIKPILLEYTQAAEVTGDVYKRKIITNINIPDGRKIPLDKNLFQRVLENLLQNALRYTKENDTISIMASENKGTISISVADTGKGISEEDLQHIFELFYRGTNSRREQGMGIGLSVVKNIVDTHGWVIDVNSKLGQGTSFNIKIPVDDKQN